MELATLLGTKPKPRSAFDEIRDARVGKVQFGEAPAKDESQILLFYRHFGMPLERNTTNQLVGECPVCQKQKFFANCNNGQWDCKVCSASGNMHTFMPWFNDHWFQRTTEDDYADLARLRHYTIDISVMQEVQISLNRLTGEWLLPGFSQQKSIANLYSYRTLKDEESGKPYRTIVAAPGMSQLLYGVHALSPNPDRPIWICEGHWDKLAWQTLFRRMKLETKYDYLGLCGSTGFPRHYINMLHDRIIWVVTDNDDAGRKHATKLTNLLASTGTQPREYKVISWPNKLPDKYDISDACAGKGMEHWPTKG